jgi:hypothetical protein
MRKLLLYDGAGELIRDTRMEAQFTPNRRGIVFQHPVNGTMHRFIVFDISCGTFPIGTLKGKSDEAFGGIVSAHEFRGSPQRFAEVNRMRELKGLSP